MKAERKLQYFTAILLIVSLRILDLYTTYYYTPDLKLEWNPIVLVFGISWHGLITIQILFILIVSIMTYFYFARKEVIITRKDLSYYDFIYFYFNNKLKPWPRRVLSLPKKLNRHLVFDGFVLMMLSIIVSILAIAHNLVFISQIDAYSAFIMEYYHLFIPFILLAAILLSANMFFIKEYRYYKKHLNIKP